MSSTYIKKQPATSESVATCPRCGSRESDRKHGSRHTFFKCGQWSDTAGRQDRQDLTVTTNEACEVIRSLRRELAEAKATLKNHELVCYGAMERVRDGERDRAADWLEAHEFDLEIHQAPKSLRANEHRSES